MRPYKRQPIATRGIRSLANQVSTLSSSTATWITPKKAACAWGFGHTLQVRWRRLSAASRSTKCSGGLIRPSETPPSPSPYPSWELNPGTNGPEPAEGRTNGPEGRDVRDSAGGA